MIKQQQRQHKARLREQKQQQQQRGGGASLSVPAAATAPVAHDIDRHMHVNFAISSSYLSQPYLSISDGGSLQVLSLRDLSTRLMTTNSHSHHTTAAAADDGIADGVQVSRLLCEYLRDEWCRSLLHNACASSTFVSHDHHTAAVAAEDVHVVPYQVMLHCYCPVLKLHTCRNQLAYP